MVEDEADDLDERRRVGREMQARLPKPRPEHPLAKKADDAGNLGCLLAELGPIGLLIGLGTSLAWFLMRRRRSTR